MPKITFEDHRNVVCDGIACDPLKMFDDHAECGNCPFIAFAWEWLDVAIVNDI